MGKLTVRALRVVLVVVLAGTVLVQAVMVWALAIGSDPEDGSLPLTALRVITILGIVTVQVVVVCVWRLVTMVRRGTVFSHAAFRYVDVVIGAIVAAALVWFAVTAINCAGPAGRPGRHRHHGRDRRGQSWASRSSCSCCGCCSPRPSRATSKRRRCRPSWTR